MSLIAELRRRNVFRVGVAYAIVAWLLVEVAHTTFPTLQLPDWTITLVTVILIMGFPVALVIAWAFELTPEGIRPAKEVAPAESIRHLSGRKLDFVIIGLLAIAVVFLVVDNYVLEAEPEQASVAREKSIAVLLFDNLSRDPANEAFTDGIHDDILTQISKIRALKVIARTSMERLDPSLSIPEIGTKLGVAAVLEGGVQRAGDHVRINVQLIDCETEAHLWAETYDRELTAANIFAIQSEIAKTVADALRAALSPEEQDRLASIPTENLAAYEAYLLGRQRFARETAAALVEAVNYFQQAIELDPWFALAYVGLADSYAEQVFFGVLAREERLAKAQAAADKALALDDQLGEAYNSLAGIKEWWDLEDAEAMYRRALELNPNYARAYYWYGFLLSDSLGRYEEALALYRKAAELDPLSAPIIVAIGAALESLGRFGEALARFKKALEVDPGYSSAYSSIGGHYWSVSGKSDEAVVWFAKGISLDPGTPIRSAWLGWLFLELGDFDRAEPWIERSLELGPEYLWPNFDMHFLHLYRGDEAAALDYASRASALNPPHFFPDPLRGHELRAGRYAKARALYEESYPELLNEGDPTVDGSNWGAAIDLALVLRKTGEQEHADLLLNRCFQHIQTLPRLGQSGYRIADVRIYALQGDKQKALAALRQAIDEGWRSFWRYFLKHDSALKPLHDEPEYQTIVAEIEADMAEQLERVREMERNGELELVPELVAE
jgi:TolB-like protein/Tfp pilus assembly protein PilF